MNIARFLEHSVHFSGLSAAARERLASVCRTREASRGDILFAEGTSAHSLYVLARGAVRLIKESAEGKTTVVRHVQPGELFAEVVLFERERYPATAESLTDSLAIEMPCGAVRVLLEDAPFRAEFISVLFRRMCYLSDRLQQLTSGTPEERFYAFLRERGGDRDSIRCELPKKDVAAALNITPEAFSRLLRRLEEENRLNWEDDRITRMPDGTEPAPPAHGPCPPLGSTPGEGARGRQR
jgi:CRP-like cAMP-binding protein